MAGQKVRTGLTLAMTDRKSVKSALSDRLLRRVRGLGALALALLLFFGSFGIYATDARAAKYASIAYDANTGDVLFETFAHHPRYPASLTKVMTLYIVFELIEQGRLDYNTLVPISAQAAAQPPSKLGFKVGEKIKLIDAIKALITKSANDVAVAVAERVAGSESRFARLMTKKARALGMKNTTFKNASGLPHDGQITTARDMVKLGLRIQDDFPKHYKLFKTRSFRYRGKRYKNHNTLLGRVSGVDGIKTGYIRKSGFNLVTSVKHKGKHVVAVVFGGKTAKRRNAHMRSIIARALKQASTQKKRKPVLIAKPRPVMRPILPEQKPIIDQRIRVGRADPVPAPRAVIKIAKVRRHHIGDEIAKPKQVAPREARRPGTLQDQLAMLLASSGVVAAEEEQGSTDDLGVEPVPVTRSSIRRGDYHIQVGAFASAQEADAQLEAVSERAQTLLVGYAKRTIEVASGRKKIYRARFAGFESAEATATCTELRRRAIDCFVTK